MTLPGPFQLLDAYSARPEPCFRHNLPPALVPVRLAAGGITLARLGLQRGELAADFCYRGSYAAEHLSAASSPFTSPMRRRVYQRPRANTGEGKVSGGESASKYLPRTLALSSLAAILDFRPFRWPLRDSSYRYNKATQFSNQTPSSLPLPTKLLFH